MLSRLGAIYFLFELYNLYKVCYVYNKRYNYLITRKLKLWFKCEIKY